MSSGTNYQAAYFQFFQDCVDRNADAYRRASHGLYSFDDWFRDWAEYSASATSIGYLPISEILNPVYARLFTAKQNASVTQVYRYRSTPGTITAPTSFTLKGKKPIQCRIGPDASCRYLVIEIPKASGAVNSVYEAIVRDAATRRDLTFWMKIE
jgi:hypothetical protein